MLKLFTITAVLITTSAVAFPASACDMHGGGFGFGNPNANWQSYNPRSFTTDPALAGLGSDGAALTTPVPAAKARPSFSNVANRAALIAKNRMAKKAKDKADKEAKNKPVKKASLALDADR